MHRAEVVADERNRRALREASREGVEGGAEPALLELDAGKVGLGIDGIPAPRQTAGRQDAANAQRGVVARLGQELGPIAAVLAEPVQEQDPGASRAVGRLHEVGLDLGIATAEGGVARTNRRCCRPRARHAGIVRDRAYDPGVIDSESPPIRLTELTECGGCAAKLGADVLAEALAPGSDHRRARCRRDQRLGRADRGARPARRCGRVPRRT